MSKYTLFVIIQALCASVLGFAGMIVVLVMGHVNATAIIGALAAGFVVSFPIAWIIHKRITGANA